MTRILSLLRQMSVAAGIMMLLLPALGATPQTTSRSVVVVYEDGHTVVVEDWTFIYRCSSSLTAPAGMVEKFDVKSQDLHLDLGGNKTRTVRAEELARVSYVYGKRVKDRFGGWEALVEQVQITLRAGDVIRLPTMAFAATAIQHPGASIERVLLAGRQRTGNGQETNFLTVFNSGPSTGVSPSDNEIEFRFGERLPVSK